MTAFTLFSLIIFFFLMTSSYLVVDTLAYTTYSRPNVNTDASDESTMYQRASKRLAMDMEEKLKQLEAESSKKYRHSPVIFVPGFGGAQGFLEPKNVKNSDAAITWVRPSNLLFGSTLEKRMRLYVNSTTKKLYSKADTPVIFPGFDATWSIAYLGKAAFYSLPYMSSIIDPLKRSNKQFYKEGKSVFGAPYDIRKAPNENPSWTHEMKQLVEKSYQLNEGRRAVVMGHSMGGLYLLYFLNKMTDEWKKKYIRAYVTLGTPYAGSVRMAKAYLLGENFDLPVLSPWKIRNTIASFPASQFLLPSKSSWPTNEKYISIEKENLHFNTHNIEELYKLINDTTALQMFRDTRDLVDGTKPPTGVDEIYCIYGSGLLTVDSIKFRSLTDIARGRASQTYGMGDGYVNQRSLEACKFWKKGVILEAPLANHMAIMSTRSVLKSLARMLAYGN